MALTWAFWQDRPLAARSDRARLLFAFLVSCRQNDELPGLLEMGECSIAELSRLPLEAVREGLAELEAHGFVEVDAEAPLVRVPKAPMYAPPMNPNYLEGVFRRWKKMPQSPLRARHVASIRGAGEGREWFAAAWARTFATVEDHVASSTEANPIETVGATLPPTLSERLGEPLKIRSKIQNKDQDPDPDARKPKAKKLDALGGHRAAAMGLWLKQDALRASVIPGARPLRATDEALRRVADRLADGHTPEDCEHVLNVYADEARRNAGSAQWFDGVTNWRAENFARSLGRTPAPPRVAAGSSSPVSREPSEASKEIERLAELAKHRRADESRAPPGNPMSLVTGLAGVLRGGNR